jgi:hypothetical protein
MRTPKDRPIPGGMEIGSLEEIRDGMARIRSFPPE